MQGFVRVNEVINHPGKSAERALLLAGLLAAVAGLVVFLLQVNLGLKLFDFGDETEKFVAAQMINHGQHLYRDIFAHHGPVPYIIAHLYTVLVSTNDFTHIRIFQGLLALVSCAALVFSPVLKTTIIRAWVAGAYLFLLSSVWIVQGMHMVLYQQIGGLLFTVSLAQLFIPLFFGVTPHTYGLFASGVVVVASCFTAYSYGPSSVLLVVATLFLLFATVEKKEWMSILIPFVRGLLVGGAIILFWMFVFADLKGFLVYHFYFNSDFRIAYNRHSR